MKNRKRSAQARLQSRKEGRFIRESPSSGSSDGDGEVKAAGKERSAPPSVGERIRRASNGSEGTSNPGSSDEDTSSFRRSTATSDEGSSDEGTSDGSDVVVIDLTNSDEEQGKKEAIPSKQERSNQKQKKQANSDERARKIYVMNKQLETTEVKIDRLVEMLSKEYAKKGLQHAPEKRTQKGIQELMGGSLIAVGVDAPFFLVEATHGSPLRRHHQDYHHART